MDLNRTIDDLIGREGRFSDHPDDRGNWYLGRLEGTMWGITPAVARAFGYTGPMKDMPRDTAVSIYKERYWFGPKFDQVAAIDERIAERLFDIGVNAGQGVGVTFLQRALNSLNRQGRDFPDLTVDGAIGKVTLSAMRAFIEKRGKDGRTTLFFMIASQHSVHYIQVSESRPANEEFQFGWQLQRAMEGVMP